MRYTSEYESPLEKIFLASEAGAVIGLWFEGQKYFAARLGTHEEKETPAILSAKRWLDDYFSGENPKISVPLRPEGTAFQKEIWNLLLKIPYGETTTYGKLAQICAERRGSPRFSAQAVGGAVGRNPISLLIPCHRVIGADGSLTGYAGGTEKKEALLRLEGAL